MTNIAGKYGIIGGLVLIIFSIVMNIFVMKGITGNFVTDSMITLILSIAVLVIIVILAVKAVREWRNANEGVINFNHAFTSALLTLVIIAFINSIYSYTYNNFIDPDYVEKVKIMQIDKLEEMDISDEQKEIAIERIEKNTKEFTVSRAVKSFGAQILGSALVALIIAAAIKKNIHEVPEL